MYSYIFHPKYNYSVSIYSKEGKIILHKCLLSIRGGNVHKCSVNQSSTRCKKSNKNDGNCMISLKKRCKKRNYLQIKKILYKNINDYWIGSYSKDIKHKFKIIAIYYNIEEILQNIYLKKINLEQKHIKLLEKFYDYNIINPLYKTFKKIEKKIKNIQLFEKEMNLVVLEKINSLTSKIEELEKKESVMDKDILQKEEHLYEKSIREKATQNNLKIEQLDIIKIEDLLFDLKLITEEEIEVLEINSKKQNKILNPVLYKDYDNLSKLIHELRIQKINLNKNKFKERKKTKKLTKERQKVEYNISKILIDFFIDNDILQLVIDELSSEKTESSKINIFSKTPREQALQIINNDYLFNNDDLTYTGFIPFTDQPFSNKFINKSKSEYEDMEVQWWVDFFNAGKNINTKMKQCGLDFITYYSF